jgi:hypothetical protein
MKKQVLRLRAPLRLAEHKWRKELACGNARHTVGVKELV